MCAIDFRLLASSLRSFCKLKNHFLEIFQQNMDLSDVLIHVKKLSGNTTKTLSIA